MTLRYSKKTLRKLRFDKLAEKNPNWLGDKVGVRGLHDWIKKRMKRPKRCQDCRKVKPLDLANVSQKYLRDLTDWEWLCRRCHMTKDGRIKKLISMGPKAREARIRNLTPERRKEIAQIARRAQLKKYGK